MSKVDELRHLFLREFCDQRAQTLGMPAVLGALIEAARAEGEAKGREAERRKYVVALVPIAEPTRSALVCGHPDYQWCPDCGPCAGYTGGDGV